MDNSNNNNGNSNRGKYFRGRGRGKRGSSSYKSNEQNYIKKEEPEKPKEKPEDLLNALRSMGINVRVGEVAEEPKAEAKVTREIFAPDPNDEIIYEKPKSTSPKSSNANLGGAISQPSWNPAAFYSGPSLLSPDLVTHQGFSRNITPTKAPGSSLHQPDLGHSVGLFASHHNFHPQPGLFHSFSSQPRMPENNNLHPQNIFLQHPNQTRFVSPVMSVKPSLHIPLPLKPNVDLRPPTSKSLPPAHFLKHVFNEQLNNLLEKITPPEEDRKGHLSSLQYLSSLTQKYFGPGAQVLPYGSIASGMWLKGSGDIDICILLNEETEKVNKVASLKMEEELKLEHEKAEADRFEKWKSELAELEKEGSVEIVEEIDSETEEEKAETKSSSTKKRKVKKFKERQFRGYTMGQYILDSFASEVLEKQDRFVDIKVLTKTRVPIIKLKDKETNINIDLGFDNFLGVLNTRLIVAYSHIDKRFKQLVLLVKHWAKRKTINDTYAGTLSSYAYVLMLIHFLQYACFPPILPNLQIVEPQLRKLKVGENEFNTYFFEDLPRFMNHWDARNTQTIGELLYEFFYYWAHVFDYKTQVASIRIGGILSKEDKGWVPLVEQEKLKAENQNEVTNVEVNASEEIKKKSPAQRYWFCIEDPFEITHNLGRPVGRDSLYFIRGEFLQACSCFGNAKYYRPEYLKELKMPVKVSYSEDPFQSVFDKIFEESKYKTREEHKLRNKENKEFGEKRKARKESGVKETETNLLKGNINE